MGEYADMAIEAGIDDWFESRNAYGNYTINQRDPLYYHTYYEDISLEATTEKAYLLKFNDGDKCWVAKSLCRKLTPTSVYIWHGATLTPIKET